MGKKKSPAGHSKRIDPADYGIDLTELLDEIKPHLARMTNAEVGEAAGMSAAVVNQILNGHKPVSLGSLAALADAADGELVLKFKRRRSRKR